MMGNRRSPDMNVERLFQLSRVLDSIPACKLNMDRWSSECGTTCCLAGWARKDAWFVADRWITEIFAVDKTGYLIPITMGNTFYALASMFDITREESYVLFG